MNTIWLLVVKDLRLLLRDRLGVFVTFALPFAFALLFGFVFAESDKPRGALRVGIVDDARSRASAGYVRALERTPELSVTAMPLSRAREQLRRGDLSLYVHLSHAPSEDVEHVDVVYGPGRRIEASVLQGALLRAVGAIGQGQAGMVGLPFRLTTRAADIASRKQGPFDASLPLGMVWGIVCCASIFGVSLVVERQRRTLDRLRTTPISTFHLLASKAIACCISIMAVQIALMVAGHLALGVRVDSPGLFLLAIFCTGLAFGGLVLALAVVSPTERAATGIGWGALTLLAMVGGGTIPLTAMPPWLESLSHLSPFSWAVTAVQGAMWRGFSLREMLPPCGSLLAASALFFAVGNLAFREE